MEAKIVIGLGFGDEGKGITTDFLASNAIDPTCIVRFSGGQQAGHTVQQNGIKHTYSTFGSGTGQGFPTYISEFCTFYPPNALNEYEILVDKGFKPLLFVHPLAKLTTHWDVAWGRVWERINNHGSCGVGVGATMARSEQTPYKLFAVDLKHTDILLQKLHGIGRYYMDKLKELKVTEEDRLYFSHCAYEESKRFLHSLTTDFMGTLAAHCIEAYNMLHYYKNLIFEGSQGILLDMEHGIFPNVTYSSTTSKNALIVCSEIMGTIDPNQIDVYYVTRCYSTRHGEGWMPDKGDITLINNSDECNVWNEWQKSFRVSEIDYSLLKYAVEVDNAYSWGYSKNLVVTCMDQRPDFKFDYAQLSPIFDSIYESWSPDSMDFKRVH